MKAMHLASFSGLDPEKTCLRIAGVQDESIVDGPGLRMTVFTQGCHHHCRACHNPQTHALHGGELRPLARLMDAYLQNPLLRGMTFSGGEPFLQAQNLAHLANAVHEAGGDITCYTGYCYEELRRLAQGGKKAVGALLAVVDLLIDGPYIEELRDLDLAFRGSSNQRILSRADMRALDSIAVGTHAANIPCRRPV